MNATKYNLANPIESSIGCSGLKEQEGSKVQNELDQKVSNQAIEILSNKRSALLEKRDNLNQQKGKLERGLNTLLEKNVQYLNAPQQNLQKMQEEKQSLKNEAQSLKEAYQEKEKLKETKTKDLKQLGKQQNEIQISQEKSLKEKESLEQTRDNTLVQLKALESDTQAKCTQLTKKLETAKENHTKLENQHKELTTKFEEFKSNFSHAEKELTSFENKIRELSGEKSFFNSIPLIKILAKKIFQHVNKKAIQAHENSILNKKQEIETLRTNLNTNENEIKQLQTKLTENENTQTQTESELKSLPAQAEQKTKELEKTLQEITSQIEEKTKETNEQIEILSRLNQSISTLSKDIQGIDQELQSLELSQQANTEQIQEKDKQIESEEKAQHKILSILHSTKEAYLDVNSKLNDVKKQLTQINKDLEELDTQLKMEQKKTELTVKRRPLKMQATNIQNLSKAILEEDSKSNPVPVKAVNKKSQEVFVNSGKINASETDLDAPLGLEAPLAKTPTILVSQEPTTPPPDLLSQTYTIKGTTYGTEKIHRDNTMQREIQFTENMIRRLEGKLQNNNIQLNEKERTQINKDIQFYKDALTKAKAYLENNKNWIDSNYFRDLIGGEVIDECQSFEKAVENYISAPVNMRYQELTTEKGQAVGIYRVGVMSDMRNGWYSLADLEAMKKDPSKIDEKITEIEQELKPASKSFFSKLTTTLKIKKEKKLTENQKQSAEYALKQLREMKANPSEVAQKIAERKQIIQKQMIQLVMAQIEKNGGKISSESQTFDLVHVCLLNQEKSSFDKSGWVHDERVEIEDMSAIFKEFQGKTLVFDGSGPAIEGNNIYLPPELVKGENAPKTLTLNTFIFNTSVQGNVENTKLQKELNTEQLNKLLKHHPDFFKDNEKLKQQLLSGAKSGYGLAEDFLFQLLKSGKLAVSTGCLSAKDRTGFICARLMQRALNAILPKGVPNPFESKILSKKFLAYKVVVENGHYAVKVNPAADLRGYESLKARGKIGAKLLKGAVIAQQIAAEKKKKRELKGHVKNMSQEVK